MKYSSFTLSVLCGFACSNIQAQKQVADHPNLVIILADQWRGDALGCLNREPVHTPHLDGLAAEGVNFTNAVSNYPVSSPARAMLMTGMYPMKNKVIHNCNSEGTPYHIELPEEARCWSDVLAHKGYATAYFGKWHLDAPHRPYIDTYNNRGKVAWNEWCAPQRRHGFKEWIAYGTYDNHLQPMYWNTTASRDSFYYVNRWGPEYEANLAVDFINRQQSSQQPFAMVVSMNPPHTGYELVPDKYKALYKNVNVDSLCLNRPDIPAAGTEDGNYYRNNILNYYACMSGVDENVGKIIEALKDRNLLNNTIVVFTSDHGVCMGSHHEQGKNIYYEESMRIPLIISWQGKLKARADSCTMLGFGDLYPTLLSLMGFKEDIPHEVQTYDLSKYILKGKRCDDIVQPYYYIRFDNPSTGYRGLRTNRYTFAIHATDGNCDDVILFDRNKDMYEMNNIALSHPKIVKKLTAQLKKLLNKTDDPFTNYIK
jgi:arylsulfatase A-like enzyme